MVVEREAVVCVDRPREDRGRHDGRGGLRDRRYRRRNPVYLAHPVRRRGVDSQCGANKKLQAKAIEKCRRTGRRGVKETEWDIHVEDGSW